MNIKQSVMNSIKWSAGVKYAGQLITWTITIYVMRLLRPADYGLISMASVFIAFGMLMSELGIGPALVQSNDLNDTKLRQSFSFVVIVCSTLFVLTYLSAPLLVLLYDEPKLLGIVKLMSVQFIVITFCIIPQSLLVRNLRFKELSLIDLSSAVSGGVVTLLLALYGFGATALVLGSLSSLLIKTIGVNWVQPVCCRPSLTLRDISALVSYGKKVTMSRVLWFFYSQADIFIIGRVLGKDMLGYYSIAMNLASIPMDKTSGILSQVAFPAFSRLQPEKEKASQYFLKAVRIIGFIFIPLLWGMSCLGREAFAIFLGPQWSMAVLPFQFITLVVPIRMISNMTPSFFDGMGMPDLSLKNLIVACTLIPIGFFAGTHYGIIGVSMVWVLLFPVVFFYNMHRSLPFVGLRLIDIFNSINMSILSGVIMYAVVYTFKIYLYNYFNKYIALSICIFLGIFTYYMISQIINKSCTREVLSLFKYKK